MKKNDKWLPIKPAPGAIIVNIGDMFEVKQNELNSDSVVVQREENKGHELWFFGIFHARSELRRKSKETIRKAYLGVRAKIRETTKREDTWKVVTTSVIVINGEKLVIKHQEDVNLIRHLDDPQEVAECLAKEALVSEDEDSFLTGGDDPYDDNVVLRNLYHSNLKLLLVTEGSEGCRYYTKEFKGRVSCLKVKVVDTTGAGDAFVGAILNNLASNLNLYMMLLVGECRWILVVDTKVN
ncbi:hypothetical protein AgCh_022915 [Apium graveolens]